MAAKIRKHIKKYWKVNLCWMTFIAFFAVGMLIWYTRQLRLELADSQQVLKQCQHTQSIWESQISSGEIRILKRDGDTQIIERWEMTKEPATDTWILK